MITAAMESARGQRMIIQFNLDKDSCLKGANLEVTPIELLLIKTALGIYFNDTRNNWMNRKMVWSMLLDFEEAEVKVMKKDE